MCSSHGRLPVHSRGGDFGGAEMLFGKSLGENDCTCAVSSSRPQIDEGKGGVGALGAEVAEGGGGAGGVEAGEMGEGGAAEVHDAGVGGGAAAVVVGVEADGAEAAGLVAENAGGAERGEYAQVRDVVDEDRGRPAPLAFPITHERGI